MKAQALEWLKAGSPAHYYQILGIILYAHLEWWLPRTEKVNANSSIEGIGNLLKMMLLDRIPLIGRLVTAMATKSDALPVNEAPPTDAPK